MDPSAMEVLLLCLGDDPVTAKRERLARVPPEAWAAVVAAAKQHQVAPLLHGHCKSLGVDLPADIAIALRQAYRDNAVRNLHLYEQFAGIARALQAKGIPVIALKGIHLAEAVYRNIALRPMLDIDLLVEEQDLESVEQELFGRGYEPSDQNRVVGHDNYQFHYKQPETATEIEVHWALFPSAYPVSIPAEDLWARARSATLARTSVLVLPLEDLLLYLCLHAAKDLYRNPSVRMLCDISEIIKHCGAEMDWETLGANVQQRGAGHATYLFLRLTRELLNAAIPQDWLEKVRPSSFDESYLKLAQDQILSRRRALDGSLLPSPNLGRIWKAKGLGGKLAVIRERITLSRKTMSLTYAAPASSWRIYPYYLVRVKDLLVRYGPTSWRLMLSDPETNTAAAHTSQVLALNEWLLRK